MSTIRETFRAVRRAKTVRELMQAVPRRTVGTAATALLCYLCVVPLLASMTYDRDSMYIFDSDAVSFLTSSTFPYSDHWYRLMSTVIILSVLFIGYAAVKLYFSLHDARRPLSAWLRGHRAVLFFGLLFGWAAVSFAFSSHHFRSFFGTGYRHDGLLTYLLYIGIFCMTIQMDKRQMRAVMECFAAVGAVLGLICVFPASGFARLFYLNESGFKLSIFLQRTHFGYFLSLCVPVGVFLLLTDEYAADARRRGLQMAARGVECWLLFNAMVFNATRATIVAVVCMTAAANIAVFLGYREHAKRMLAVDARLAATVLFLNSGNNLFIRTQASAAYMRELREASLGFGGDDDVTSAMNRLTSSRYAMWTAGARYALQKPLFGWGPDNLGELYFYDGMAYTDRPHNELIQIAASLGFPALGLYLAGLLQWAKPFVQKWKQLGLFDLGVALVAGCYLVNSVFSNSMFYTTPYFYMFLGFAYCRVSNDNVASL